MAGAHDCARLPQRIPTQRWETWDPKSMTSKQPEHQSTIDALL